MEIVGIRPTVQTIVTGVEMFRKLLDQAQAGDNIGALLRGTKREDVDGTNLWKMDDLGLVQDGNYGQNSWFMRLKVNPNYEYNGNIEGQRELWNRKVTNWDFVCDEIRDLFGINNP
eukprot:CAMPEP_0184674022 /NCGR_PEP_ID=MMETSP0308-20130426/87009_1 /TAXON_ID=38269 /ORGANISM="Gloeochaete witrockiana, Strain SAG 46.84" /LENGTH=115 /DNA_ID=CAMNT_0027121583 /DNA_START=132 /DNA_END=480 /DNA_ORIENTATION=-